jgi:hypothetical protein
VAPLKDADSCCAWLISAIADARVHEFLRGTEDLPTDCSVPHSPVEESVILGRPISWMSLWLFYLACQSFPCRLSSTNSP